MNSSIVRHWNRGRTYLYARQLPAAQAEFDTLLRLAPDDARTHWMAAGLAWRQRHAQVAANEIRLAAQDAPDDPEFACDIAEIARRIGETSAAHTALERSGWEGLVDTAVLARYIDLRQQLGEPALALAAVDRLLALQPDAAPYHCMRGQQLETLGRFDEAAAAYRDSLDRSPTLGHAACHLLRLPGQATHPDSRKRVQQGLLQSAPGSRALADFQFAHYHVSAALGDHAVAWSALVAGNALVRALLGQRATDQETNLRRLGQTLTHMQPPSIAAPQPDSPVPIFILGMPRSGSSMLAQMLGNHSETVNGGELTDFSMQLLYVADVCSDHDEQFYARLPNLDWATVGRRYLEQIAWRRADKRFFIDKLPGNWIVAGEILAALPNARILNLQRDPMDACFSAWCTRFGGLAGWTYALPELAAHHQTYRQYMRNWHAAYPGSILDVQYEELARAPAATLQRIFAFCGLPWEPGCEDLTHNRSPVMTASAVQIREPVHTRTIGSWRPYAKQLEPLRAALDA